jgi:hypothetical protein
VFPQRTAESPPATPLVVTRPTIVRLVSDNSDVVIYWQIDAPEGAKES